MGDLHTKNTLSPQHLMDVSNSILVEVLICANLFEILDMFRRENDHNIMDLFLRLFQTRLRKP